MSLNLEVLEARALPATTTLLGGTLAIVGDGRADVFTVTTTPDGGNVQAVINGVTRLFQAAAVQRIVLDGQGGNDTLTAQVPTVPDVLLGGPGADNLQAFGSTSVVLGGPGADVIYAIVGQGAFLDGGAGRDRVIGNTTSIIAPDRADFNAIVFGAAQAPFQVVGGVLLLVGTPGNDSGTLTQQGNQIFLSYNGVSATFARGAFDAVAAVFAGGDDRFFNLTNLDQVMYGAAGNDMLVGTGTGFKLLKGGSGDDVLLAAAGNFNDLTGDAGADTLIGGTVLRVDALDTFTVVGNVLLIGWNRR